MEKRSSVEKEIQKMRNLDQKLSEISASIENKRTELKYKLQTLLKMKEMERDSKKKRDAKQLSFDFKFQ